LFVLALTDSLKAHCRLRQPTRVTVLVTGSSEYREELAPVIIEHALSTLGIPKTETLFLAREDWGRPIHLVFDIYHASYDFDTAHIIAHDMPVIMVSLGKKNDRMWFAAPPLAEQVNRTIAELHNLNGWGKRPPYFIDHARGAVPAYDSPRDVTVLGS
jgi:hypothetical protein